jgi:curli biogenesis system outer membrane secretion channel CsgG
VRSLKSEKTVNQSRKKTACPPGCRLRLFGFNLLIGLTMTIRSFSLSVVTIALLSACAATDMKMGAPEAKTAATGAAGGAEATGANAALEKCDSPLGTVSLVENQAASWYTVLTHQYRLPPTASLLRLMVQQSNCFIVVERGAAGMAAMQRERALMQGGEMRQGSQMGGGQMVAADYAMAPEVIFNEGNTGGAAAGLGRAIGGLGGAMIGLAGSVKTREASTMLTLVDNRSGVQVSASEGSASKRDWTAGLGGLFGSGGGALGGYTNTPQGKVIAAAFMDSYNNMVKSLRNYKAQSVRGQGLGGGGRLGVDGGAGPSQTSAPGVAPATAQPTAPARIAPRKPAQ